MQTTKVSRASAVNRLALLPSSKPLAIVRHFDDESSGGAELYGALAPVAVSATMNVAPWQESFAALLIEIAFARSRFKLPFTAPLLAGTSQPVAPLVCGEVTVTLAVLQALCPPSTVTAPSETELTCTRYGFGLLTTAATSADAVG